MREPVSAPTFRKPPGKRGHLASLLAQFALPLPQLPSTPVLSSPCRSSASSTVEIAELAWATRVLDFQSTFAKSKTDQGDLTIVGKWARKDSGTLYLHSIV